MAHNKMIYKHYPNLFKRNYSVLSGKAWLKTIAKDDLQAFTRIGFAHSDYGKLGGIARAKNASRDSKGKFISATKSQRNCNVIFSEV